MTLELLIFNVEGGKYFLKPELHRYHWDEEDDGLLGYVSAMREHGQYASYKEFDDIDDDTELVLNLDNNVGWIVGWLEYNVVEGTFKTFVPYESDQISKKFNQEYNREFLSMGVVYSALKKARDPVTKGSFIKEKNFYRNSQGEWKDIGMWLGVYRHDELLKMADEAE